MLHEDMVREQLRGSLTGLPSTVSPFSLFFFFTFLFRLFPPRCSNKRSGKGDKVSPPPLFSPFFPETLLLSYLFFRREEGGMVTIRPPLPLFSYSSPPPLTSSFSLYNRSVERDRRNSNVRRGHVTPCYRLLLPPLRGCPFSFPSKYSKQKRMEKHMRPVTFPLSSLLPSCGFLSFFSIGLRRNGRVFFLPSKS